MPLNKSGELKKSKINDFVEKHGFLKIKLGEDVKIANDLVFGSMPVQIDAAAKTGDITFDKCILIGGSTFEDFRGTINMGSSFCHYIPYGAEGYSKEQEGVDFRGVKTLVAGSLGRNDIYRNLELYSNFQTQFAFSSMDPDVLANQNENFNRDIEFLVAATAGGYTTHDLGSVHEYFRRVGVIKRGGYGAVIQVNPPGTEGSPSQPEVFRRQRPDDRDSSFS